MTDLSQLLNDAEAAVKCRIKMGLPVDEEYGAEGAHPKRTNTCVMIGTVEKDEKKYNKLIWWLEDNAKRYGYKVTGSYIAVSILEAA